MKESEVAAVLRGIAPAIRGHVSKEIVAVSARLDAMEKSHEDSGRRAIDAETAVGKRIEGLEAQVKETTEGIPGHIAKALAERPATVEIAQIVEALRCYDLELYVREALALGAEHGGVEIIAPWEVATEMTAAISMLSTAAPVTKAIERGSGVQPLKPRIFRFDRDERGLITGAFEDYGS
jgi:hypothetical protein